MDKFDLLLLKAKALAALEAGVFPWPENDKGERWTHVARVTIERLPEEKKREVTERLYTNANQRTNDEWWDSPITAIAAAADALGLEPDHAVVVLTEEEKATVNDALLYYQNIALEHAVDQERRGYVESAEAWRRTAEQAESLRQRLAE